MQLTMQHVTANTRIAYKLHGVKYLHDVASVSYNEPAGTVHYAARHFNYRTQTLYLNDHTVPAKLPVRIV